MKQSVFNKLLCCVLAVLMLAASAAGLAEGGQAVILFTTDIHCNVSEGIGYAGVAGLKKALAQEGNDVVLIDAGDAIQGTALGTLSEGEYILDIMNAAEYDLAVPGNHEFDYGLDRFFELA